MISRLLKASTGGLVASALILSGACAGTSREPRPTGNWGAAVNYITPATTGATFTDWDVIRKASGPGAATLTGASDYSDKLKALVPALIGDPENIPAAPEAFFDSAIYHQAFHPAQIAYNTWGFDLFDLDWELVVYEGENWFAVEHFRDDLTLPRIEALLDQHGFASEALPFGSLRTWSSGAEEMGSTFGSDLFMMAHSGLMNDGRTLVAAIAGEPVRAALAREAGDSVPESVLLGSAALAQPTAAIVLSGTACSLIGPSASTPSNAAADDLLDAAGARGSYDALVFGYSRSLNPIARFVFAYGSPEAAKSDLSVRQKLATDGVKYTDGTKFSQTAFVVENAHVEGRAVVIEVSPALDSPRSLFPLLGGDMMFATCGSSAEEAG